MSRNNGATYELPEDGSIPDWLMRDTTNQSEFTHMSKTAGSVARATEAATASEAPAKPVKGKPAAKPAAKAAAKPATNGKAAKAAPPAKPAKTAAKAKEAKAPRNVDPSKLDKFGLRKESLKSQAAAMYAKGKGATLAEVKDALNSSQFNVLTELEGKGFKIERTPIKGDGVRSVTRYKLHPKE